MSNKQIKVKILTRFPTWSFERQTPNYSNSWENLDFNIDNNNNDCDWFVVFGGLIKKEVINCAPNNTILITDEPSSIKKYHPDFIKQFKTVITVQKDIVAPNIIKRQLLPWFVGAHFNINKKCFDSFSKSYDELKKQNSPTKTKIISVITSNKNKTIGHKKRLRFIKILKNYFGDKLDVFGFGINKVDDKWEAIAPYKYHLVLENSLEENYWTEKLADAYLSGSYPIYYGCPNIYDYFDSNSLTKIDISDPVEAIKTIEKIIAENYDEKFKNKILESKEKILNHYQIFPQLCEIINKLEKERKNDEKISFIMYPEIIKKDNILSKNIGLIGIFLKKNYPSFYVKIKNYAKIFK